MEQLKIDKETLRRTARYWKDKYDNKPTDKPAEREHAAAVVAVAAAAASPRTRGLSLVELEEEMCEAESRSPSRCGGDGVYSQEGKIQKRFKKIARRRPGALSAMFLHHSYERLHSGQATRLRDLDRIRLSPTSLRSRS